MTKINKKANKVLCLFSGILMVFVSMNIMIFTAPTVLAEGGSPTIHVDEIGFSTEFVTSLSTTLYCPRFEQNSDWETQFIISNPSSDDAELDIYYYDSSGQLIDIIYEEISSKQTIDFISVDHDITEESGSLVISSDIPIFGDVIYYSEYCGAAEPLQSSLSTGLYCPGFYQTDTWDTWICINNMATESTDLTLTYFDDEGNELDEIYDTIDSQEIRYFQPSDDDIEDSFGSILIESSTENAIIGYVLKIKNDGTIAYSYSLKNYLKNNHCNIFLTSNEDTNEIVIFNPESQVKTLNFFFYHYDGTSLDSLNDYQLDSYSTMKLIINDYVDNNLYGFVKIDCNLDGVIGYYGHIGANYGFGNSIEMVTQDQFYSTFKTYKPTDEYPLIGLANTNSQTGEYEMITHNIDGEDEQNGEEVLTQNQVSGIDGGFFGPQVEQITYPTNGHGDCMGPSQGGDGDCWDNFRTADSDNDGLPDWIEKMWVGVIGGSCFQVGDPNDPDTDGDGLPDGWEYYKLGMAAVRDATGDNGPDGDPDSDGLDNDEEYDEGTHPKRSDTDGDGLSDGDEVNTHGTNPLKKDTDDDGRDDKIEVDNGLDATTGNIDWTFIVYMAADNNLDSASVEDINEMETIGCTDDISIIVQIDRADSGDWTGTRRYLILKDTDTGNINSHLIQNMGELNMGVSSTLSNYAKWARNTFPATKYALILWDHGGGWTGLCSDETSSSDKIIMSELKTAMNAITYNGADPVDLLGFDACVMGELEVAYQIRGTADYLVGSENSEPNDGWPYEDILSSLDSSPTMTASTLATTIVDDYIDSYTDGESDPSDEDSVTMAAIDMSKIPSPNLYSKVDTFAQKLSDALNVNVTYYTYYKAKLMAALAYTSSFKSALFSLKSLRDIYYIAEYMKNNIANDPTYDNPIKTAATDVMDYISDSSSNKAVIKERDGGGTDVGKTKGLTIFFPDTKVQYNNYKSSYTSLDFCTCKWDEFLIDYYNPPT